MVPNRVKRGRTGPNGAERGRTGPNGAERGQKGQTGPKGANGAKCGRTWRTGQLDPKRAKWIKKGPKFKQYVFSADFNVSRIQYQKAKRGCSNPMEGKSNLALLLRLCYGKAVSHSHSRDVLLLYLQ